MQPGQSVRTFTGQRGGFDGFVRVSHQSTPNRVSVRLDVRIEGGPPIAVRCLYRPTDVTAEPPGDDCPDECPDNCPTHGH